MRRLKLRCTFNSNFYRFTLSFQVNVGSKVNRLRLQEGSSSNLVIQDVRSSDQGNYICKADNMVGSRETPAAKLIVKSKCHLWLDIHILS